MIIRRLIEKAQNAIKAKEPTRIVAILPGKAKWKELYATAATEARVLCEFSANVVVFHPHDYWLSRAAKDMFTGSDEASTPIDQPIVVLVWENAAAQKAYPITVRIRERIEQWLCGVKKIKGKDVDAYIETAYKKSVETSEKTEGTSDIHKCMCHNEQWDPHEELSTERRLTRDAARKEICQRFVKWGTLYRAENFFAKAPRGWKPNVNMLSPLWAWPVVALPREIEERCRTMYDKALYEYGKRNFVGQRQIQPALVTAESWNQLVWKGGTTPRNNQMEQTWAHPGHVRLAVDVMRMWHQLWGAYVNLNHNQDNEDSSSDSEDKGESCAAGTTLELEESDQAIAMRGTTRRKPAGPAASTSRQQKLEDFKTLQKQESGEMAEVPYFTQVEKSDEGAEPYMHTKAMVQPKTKKKRTHSVHTPRIIPCTACDRNIGAGEASVRCEECKRNLHFSHITDQAMTRADIPPMPRSTSGQNLRVRCSDCSEYDYITVKYRAQALTEEQQDLIGRIPESIRPNTIIARYFEKDGRRLEYGGVIVEVDRSSIRSTITVWWEDGLVSTETARDVCINGAAWVGRGHRIVSEGRTSLGWELWREFVQEAWGPRAQQVATVHAGRVTHGGATREGRVLYSDGTAERLSEAELNFQIQKARDYPMGPALARHTQTQFQAILETMEAVAKQTREIQLQENTRRMRAALRAPPQERRSRVQELHGLRVQASYGVVYIAPSTLEVLDEAGQHVPVGDGIFADSLTEQPRAHMVLSSRAEANCTICWGRSWAQQGGGATYTFCPGCADEEYCIDNLMFMANSSKGAPSAKKVLTGKGFYHRDGQTWWTFEVRKEIGDPTDVLPGTELVYHYHVAREDWQPR